MNFDEFMNKVRQWDNRSNQWFMRHFYVLFFQMILVVAFVLFFALTINTLNIASDIQKNSLTERILLNQNFIGLLIVFLMILNSFWMLFMFSGMLRIRSVLKNIDFSLSHRKNGRHSDDND